MNEEVVTKMSPGIGWKRLMGDSEIKGKHQLCHLSCDPLMAHGKKTLLFNILMILEHGNNFLDNIHISSYFT